jgi:hypothetical protein
MTSASAPIVKAAKKPVTAALAPLNEPSICFDFERAIDAALLAPASKSAVPSDSATRSVPMSELAITLLPA